MHRIASLPGEDSSQNLALVEQPAGTVLVLTSASSDITTLSNVTRTKRHKKLYGNIRALHLSNLQHQAQIDHYFETTAKYAEVIVVRMIGSRSHWSYGFQKLIDWIDGYDRKLLILSGTSENTLELNSLSTIDYEDTIALGELLRVGGIHNWNIFLDYIQHLISKNDFNIKTIKPKFIDDPHKYDWRNENGLKVGIIAYSSYFQSGDIEVIDTLATTLRKNNLVPRILYVSSLKTSSVESKVADIFRKEKLSAIITTTSFSVNNESTDNTKPVIWDDLNVPIFQFLISTSSHSKWQAESRGLSPTDLALQVVLPELDGRITTRIIGFRELIEENVELSTPVYITKAHHLNIDWCTSYLNSWIQLQTLKVYDVRLVLTISNYPISDGRLANGVGLDTPQSLINILSWLSSEGYNLGKHLTPSDSHTLIKQLINSRTNSQESQYNTPLAYLSLDTYLKFWNTIPEPSRNEIEKVWGAPSKAEDCEVNGFAINGIKFGNVSILIQPKRGYSQENIADIHSPYLPPPHKYIAQYFWIMNSFKANALVHVGKHGTLEWLPGKSVGLSNQCFPHITIPPIPHIYPFIVNDPGEGSQAKRRTEAVILDHLTPPLVKAEGYDELLLIESLIDEYHESSFFSEKRSLLAKSKILDLINNKDYRNILSLDNTSTTDELINDLESYICELKDAQIRGGLHIYGQEPPSNKLVELIYSISLAPTFNELGLSQLIGNFIGFELDPWSDPYGNELSAEDKDLALIYFKKNCRINGHVTCLINEFAKDIVSYYVQIYKSPISANKLKGKLHERKKDFLDLTCNSMTIVRLNSIIIPNVLRSPVCEKDSFLNGLRGKRIDSGPSGAPTRGKVEVLPTGRNFYSLDLRGLPTECAWDLGRRSAQNILDLYLLDNGNHLTHLAISIWATSTMRNGGEDIAQVLSLMGVLPVWDKSTGRVIDLEVIPTSSMDRPRVDVTVRISGLFRDSFPQLIDLLSKALRIVGSLDESETQNPYAYDIKSGNQSGRIYGSAPETYGTGLQELINLGSWESKGDLARTFTEWSKWLYESSADPVIDKKGFSRCMKNIQVVLHNQDNREHDILDSDDYYQFQGGLSSVVEEASGKLPKVYFADHSKYSSPKVTTLEREIDKVVRSRLVNPKWIEGMKDHGYKGAFEMSASLDYLFAYDATTSLVPKWCYSKIYSSWLIDQSTFTFLKNKNPWSLRDIAERLLEAHNRNLWKNATTDQLENIKKIVIDVEKDIENREV